MTTLMIAKDRGSGLRVCFNFMTEHIYIYPCIEFGRLGCACIIFKCSMNAIILAQVNLNQNSIHCCFFLGL